MEAVRSERSSESVSRELVRSACADVSSGDGVDVVLCERMRR